MDLKQFDREPLKIRGRRHALTIRIDDCGPNARSVDENFTDKELRTSASLKADLREEHPNFSKHRPFLGEHFV